MKQKAQEDKREDSLQAVVRTCTLYCAKAFEPTEQVLADSFETRFKPFTLERPRVSAPVYKAGMLV